MLTIRHRKKGNLLRLLLKKIGNSYLRKAIVLKNVKKNRIGLELGTQSFEDRNLPNFRISSFFEFFSNSSRTKFFRVQKF